MHLVQGYLHRAGRDEGVACHSTAAQVTIVANHVVGIVVIQHALQVENHVSVEVIKPYPVVSNSFDLECKVSDTVLQLHVEIVRIFTAHKEDDAPPPQWVLDAQNDKEGPKTAADSFEVVLGLADSLGWAPGRWAYASFMLCQPLLTPLLAVSSCVYGTVSVQAVPCLSPACFLQTYVMRQPASAEPWTCQETVRASAAAGMQWRRIQYPPAWGKAFALRC